MRERLVDWSLKVAADVCRLALAPLLQIRCRRCLMTEPLLDNGCCRVCQSNPGQNPPAAAPTEANLGSAVCAATARGDRNARRYDAIILVSGGKDSLYMLARVRLDFPDLRPLAVSVDNGFLNPLSLRNIEAACKAQGVDTMIVRPDKEIYRRLLEAGFEQSEKFGCYRIDCMDGAIFRDIASRLAVSLSIPLVLSGHTAAQTRTILGIDDFRLPPDRLCSDRTDYFGIPVESVFGIDTEHVWKGSKVEPKRVPEWIFPLHVWRPTQAEIEGALRVSGFEPAKVKQYLTGNALQAVFLLHDLWHRGRFSYEPEVAILLRASLVDRAEWRRIFTLMEIAGRSHALIRHIAAPPLETLGLDFDRVFAKSRRAPGSSEWQPRDATDHLTRAQH